MSQLRVEKVQELMKQEISEIILRELKDPRIGFVTVTGVECTGGFIRREIGHRIRLRFTPELHFELDKSLDYGAHIHELLLQIDREDKARDEKYGTHTEPLEDGAPDKADE